LRTDHLDLLHIHMNPSRTVLESTGAVEALLDLQKRGMTRFLGCSSGLPELVDHIDMDVFDVFQLPYSGIDRQHENAISDTARSGAGVVIRGSFGTDRVSAASRPRRLDWSVLESDTFAALRGSMSAHEFMLRFTISHPDVTTAIVGTKRPDELASNVAAATQGPLAPDHYEAAKQFFASLGSTAD
jgi:aryl-alcohol dehydrogenase-like predicted oxidoreductase